MRHDPAAGAWDARFEVWLAEAIDSRLGADPPPAESIIAPEAREWARNLERDGRARLDALAAGGSQVDH